MIKNIIAWDLGATKCTAGIIEYNINTHRLVCKKHYSTKLTAAVSLEDLICKLESGLEFSMSMADAICIGGAGQYDGETLSLENSYPYPMHFAQIAKQQDWPAFDVIHDYASIVCATFTSYLDQPNNIKRLNTCPIHPQGRRVALGLGTGLGIKDGVLFANGDFWLGRNEIGHIGITTPPHADSYQQKRHEELIRFLNMNNHSRNSEPVTFEKILSGQGTVRLYQFFYPGTDDSTPEQVGAKMREGKASEMLDAFAWYIGLFVGTVQLIFMPEGGVWITGGVALNHLDVFDRLDFYAGIKASPAYFSQREAYPLGVMCNQEHALIGGGYYATKRLLN
jgi:glucokinase